MEFNFPSLQAVESPHLSESDTKAAQVLLWVESSRACSFVTT
jgi:hypothetical protein